MNVAVGLPFIATTRATGVKRPGHGAGDRGPPRRATLAAAPGEVHHPGSIFYIMGEPQVDPHLRAGSEVQVHVRPEGSDLLTTS